MIASLVLALLVISGGTVATYLYDSGSPFSARVCSGSCLGITALGLLGFVFASFLGLNGTSVLLTTVVCSLPLFLLTRQTYFDSFREDSAAAYQAVRRFVTQPDLKTIGYVVFYLFTIAILWRVFSKAMIQDENGISTGLLNNFGDLPFHLSVITGFAFGNNFPPEDPTYAGVRFTYPFLSDFVSAIFVQCRADLTQSMFLENMILAVSFVGLLHRWAYVLLRDRLAAIITPLLVLLNGGFGWVMLYTKEGESTQLLGFLSKVPSFTIIPETTWRWGNAISTLLIPQRGFLMGLPLAIMVFTQWWLAADDELPRQEVSTSKRTDRKTKNRAVTNGEEHTNATNDWRRRHCWSHTVSSCTHFCGCHGHGGVPGIDRAALASLVCLLHSRRTHCRAATALVHVSQCSERKQLLCVGTRLG
jgi:hypothetical protein